MNSQRLPGKVLADIEGEPLLKYVVKRLEKTKKIEKIVIATTLNREDDKVAELARRLSVGIFRGSEEDVLGRYYQAAKFFEGNVIVRVTGEDPLIDFNVVDKVIHAFFKVDAEYATNIVPRTFPVGMDTEVFSFEILERLQNLVKDLYNREHVTTYIRDNIGDFKTVNVEAKGVIKRPDITLSVDFPKDLDFMRDLFKAVKEDGREVIELGVEQIFENFRRFFEKDVAKELTKNNPSL